MKPAMKWLIDGQPGDSVAVEDRGLAYGDGVFETIAVRGGQPRLLEYHLERLRLGCMALAIPLAPMESDLRDEIVVAACGCDYGTVKVMITRGSGPRGYSPPADPVPVRCVGAQVSEPPGRERYERGVVVRRCRTPISENAATAGLKTLARVDHVLACVEWRTPGVHEGLMAAADGRIICGTMSNLFIVTGGILRTPSLSTCGVSGVMRRLIIEQLADMDIECEETDLFWAELRAAGEVFLCNSQYGIWPVRKIDDHEWEPGPVTRALMMALFARGVAECRS